MVFSSLENNVMVVTVAIGSSSSVIASAVVLLLIRHFRKSRVQAPHFMTVLFWLFTVLLINAIVLLCSFLSYIYEAKTTCQYIGMLLNIVDISLYFYLIVMCIEIYLTFTITGGDYVENGRKRFKWYLAIICIASFGITGISIISEGSELYGPSIDDGSPFCWMVDVPYARFFFNYVYMISCYAASSVISLRALMKIPKEEYESQYSAHVKKAVAKSFLYPGFFLIIFIFDLSNRAVYALTQKPLYILTFLQAVTYSTQGTFQCTVFLYENEEVRSWWRKYVARKEENHDSLSISFFHELSDEDELVL